MILISVTDLNVIAKNVVVGYLEAAYAGSFRFSLLHLEEVILAAGAKVAEIVKLCVNACTDNRPLAYLDCGFRRHHALDFLHKGGAAFHPLEEFSKGFGAIGQPFSYRGR